MGKSKIKKKIDFRKIKKKIKDKKYHIILFFLCLIFLELYTSLFSFYRIYSFNHYHQYSSTVIMLGELKEGNFAEGYQILSDGYPNKIFLFRSLPLIIFDRITQTRYVGMAILTNLILLYLLYLSLEQVFKTEYAFYFILFIMSSYFFLETLISPYVDLHWFFATALFYLAAYKFIKKKKNNYVELVLTVFLMFLSRNIAYIHFQIIFSFLVIYMLISKVEYNRIGYFIGSSLIGFLLFFGIGFGFSSHRLVDNLDVGGMMSFQFGHGDENKTTIDTLSFQNLFKTSKSFLKNNIHIGFDFLNKFPVSLLNYLLYFSVIYSLIRKRNTLFVLLFFANEFFFVLLFNILNSVFVLRYFLAGYFIYLVLFFDLVREFVSEINKKIKKLNIKWNHVVLLIALFSVLSSIPLLKRSYDSVDLSSYLFFIDSKNTEFFHDKIFSNLVKNSSIYFEGDSAYDLGYCGQNYYRSTEKPYFEFSKHDQRFSYLLVYNFSKADYLICHTCDYDYELIKNYELNNSETGISYDVKVYRVQPIKLYS